MSESANLECTVSAPRVDEEALKTKESQSNSQAFVRNRLTWFGYFVYGLWSLLWSAFGAFIPYLRSEFHMSYSTAALHFSALALGPFLAGFFGDKLISSWGLSRTVLIGTLGMAVGFFLVIFGLDPVSTITGALFVGLGGNITSQALTNSVSKRFGEQRVIAISELQICGTVCSLLAPLAVSAFTHLGFNWRAAVASATAFFAVLIVANFKSVWEFGGASKKESRTGASKLPRVYWLFFFVVFFSVASEWTVAFWSPEFLSHVLHLSKAEAASGMSVFLFAEFVGRVLGRRILRSVAVPHMLIGSACLAAAGFIVFWTARDLPLNLLGLFLMGLGEANVYPLCLSQAIAVAVGASEKATARMSMSTGGAILIAPLLLGLLADKVGLEPSYAFVAVCLIVAALAVSFAPKDTSRYHQ